MRWLPRTFRNYVAHKAKQVKVTCRNSRNVYAKPYLDTDATRISTQSKVS